MAIVSIQTCDRCGKRIIGMSHTLIYYPTFIKKELDLCHDCHSALRQFIVDGKKKAADVEE